MDVSTQNLAVLWIGGVEIWITETIVNTWIIMLALTLFSVFVRLSLKKFEDIPTGFQNVIETLVETFDSFVRSSAGQKLYQVGNWYFMLCCFIMISNLVGVIGLRAPTADWSMAFACALSTFLAIQVMGTKFRKVAYLKSFFEPHFLFFPLNVIGELSRPISLSFRLFGNVLAGTIIMTLIYAIVPLYLRLFVPAALHIYFDLLSGAIQTYIFCVLSFSFIGSACTGDPEQEEAEQNQTMEV